MFRAFLGGIAYADRKGMTPVVDMKNTLNAYLYEHEVGRVNSWEYYFEQPGGIPLEESANHGECITLKVGKFPVPRQDSALFRNQDGQLDYWRGICRKYIRFTPPVIERLDKLCEKHKGRDVLGVLARGTDYIRLKPHDHPVQPKVPDVIAKVEEAMREEGFDSVYLATEDKKILAAFQEAFGDKLIQPECEYVDFNYDSDRMLAEYSTGRSNDKYLRGLEYLVSILFLSRCRGFIASMTSGSTGVMCLSESFEYLYVFDLGLYP